MTTQTAPKNTLTAKADNRFSVFISQDKVKAMLINTLSKNASGFIASITSAVSTNKELQKCSNDSILSAALLGAALELTPSPQLGHFYMIPFEDRRAGITKAQFVMGYKGLIQLAIRSGQYKDIDVFEIRQGEYKGRDKDTGKYIIEFIQDDEAREKLPIIGYFAYFELLNGFRKSVYWSKPKMEAHADEYSNAFKLEIYKQMQAGTYKGEAWKVSSFWYQDFDEMAKKTLIRQLLGKWGLLSTKMQKAMESDERAITMDGGVDIIDADEVPPGARDAAPAADPGKFPPRQELDDNPLN